MVWVWWLLCSCRETDQWLLESHAQSGINDEFLIPLCVDQKWHLGVGELNYHLGKTNPLFPYQNIFGLCTYPKKNVSSLRPQLGHLNLYFSFICCCTQTNNTMNYSILIWLLPLHSSCHDLTGKKPNPTSWGWMQPFFLCENTYKHICKYEVVNAANKSYPHKVIWEGKLKKWSCKYSLIRYDWVFCGRVFSLLALFFSPQVLNWCEPMKKGS